MPEEHHISSLVVHTRPDRLDGVRAEIARHPGAEIHGESAQGALVVVLEAGSQAQISDFIEAISALPQVLSAALVFHHFEAAEPARSVSP